MHQATHHTAMAVLSYQCTETPSSLMIMTTTTPHIRSRSRSRPIPQPSYRICLSCCSPAKENAGNGYFFFLSFYSPCPPLYFLSVADKILTLSLIYTPLYIFLLYVTDIPAASFTFAGTARQSAKGMRV
ncbi:hypothetical protein K504DRAFT_130523 [Pleomassaria siparia CBS 279.74]|uniref:Uncharacterized protein n=1 Tax=Pleomassaria siparia CBS 279.74 TaxID=1314801 RepID=A0A6G1KKU4_9PLEO|nr:hypothetical protein K504DRAFT_130523 [Pleomassaria siparia CBS 279.74]